MRRLESGRESTHPPCIRVSLLRNVHVFPPKLNRNSIPSRGGINGPPFIWVRKCRNVLKGIRSLNPVQCSPLTTIRETSITLDKSIGRALHLRIAQRAANRLTHIYIAHIHNDHPSVPAIRIGASARTVPQTSQARSSYPSIVPR